MTSLLHLSEIQSDAMGLWHWFRNFGGWLVCLVIFQKMKGWIDSRPGLITPQPTMVLKGHLLTLWCYRMYGMWSGSTIDKVKARHWDTSLWFFRIKVNGYGTEIAPYWRHSLRRCSTPWIVAGWSVNHVRACNRYSRNKPQPASNTGMNDLQQEQYHEACLTLLIACSAGEWIYIITFSYWNLISLWNCLAIT